MKKLICANGHDMYRVKTDIGRGDRIHAADIEPLDSRLAQPKNGDSPVCPECGSHLVYFKRRFRKPIPCF